MSEAIEAWLAALIAGRNPEALLVITLAGIVPAPFERLYGASSASDCDFDWASFDSPDLPHRAPRTESSLLSRLRRWLGRD